MNEDVRIGSRNVWCAILTVDDQSSSIEDYGGRPHTSNVIWVPVRLMLTAAERLAPAVQRTHEERIASDNTLMEREVGWNRADLQRNTDF